jgi:inhibitor of KinA
MHLGKIQYLESFKLQLLVSDYQIYSLGDSAITIELGNRIDKELNLKIIAMKEWLLSNRFDGVNDLVVAYGSLSVLFDPLLVIKKNPTTPTAFDFIKSIIQEAFIKTGGGETQSSTRFEIPVCYDEFYGIDQEFISKSNGISGEELIQLHCSRVYRVFMIGFLPGFSYMGEVDRRLVIPRKNRPVPLLAGSVGIAGSQTGVYPLNSPGGWQIIGRTPLQLFDPFADLPSKLSIGDNVQFYPITREQFEQEDWVKMGI